MELGLVALGRMEGGTTRRLIAEGHEVSEFDAVGKEG